MRHFALAIVLALLSACRVARPSEIPFDEPSLVVVKSCGIPQWMPWYSHFAEHTWIDAKEGSELAWRRTEVAGKFSGATTEPISAHLARRDWRWSDEPVRVHAVFSGDEAFQIQLKINKLLKELNERYANGGYEAWPGPNSNTFLRELTQAIPELAFAFDHNALGKDYTWFDAGLAPSRTGVHLDTWPLGLTLAAKEGLELHLLQLTFGLSLWPPRLELPFLPPIPWEREPDAAVERSAPADGIHHVVISPVHKGPGSGPRGEPLEIPVLDRLEFGHVVRIEGPKGNSWVAIRPVLVPAVAPDKPATVRAEVEIFWMGSTELAFPGPFELNAPHGCGPFALDGAVVSFTFCPRADGTLEGVVGFTVHD